MLEEVNLESLDDQESRRDYTMRNPLDAYQTRSTSQAMSHSLWRQQSLEISPHDHIFGKNLD